ncbi:M48 family metalloprotease [Haloarchaeobius sp. HRN-SO-5]|uniref:M48 family metalloprotease n=1 Tax=Haloarchaeobius sp. HRN-SO-5 TaxID=3446118 RepID=UPI003EC0B370
MERDSDLTWRILLTLGTILVVDVVLVAVVAYLLAPWLSAVQVAVARALGLEGTSPYAWAAVVVLPVAVAFVWAQLRYTRHELLAEVDASVPEGDEYADVEGRLQRLAAQADVTPPRLAVAETDVPNSFAVGRLTDATVVVSTGLLEALDDDELDAVLAHELAHVRNRDALVMTLASFVPALVSDEYSAFGSLSLGPVFWVGLLVVGYLLGAAFVDQPLFTVGYTVSFAFLAAVSVLLGGVFLGVAGAVVLLVGRHLSTYREFVADRSGAILAGDPAAMVTALTKLDEEVGAPTVDKRRQYAGVEGLCFLPHGFSDDGSAGDADEFTVETRSHPSTAQRIERLRAVEREFA